MTTRKDCKRPHRWYRQRTLKGSMTGHCQTFSESKSGITLDWVKRACHNVRIQAPKVLLDKLKQHADLFISKLKKTGMSAMLDKDPRLGHKVTTEYAMSDDAFEKLSGLHENVAKHHAMFETYLQLVLRRYATVSKRNCKKKLVTEYMDEKLHHLITLE
jgi:hypothetical protein